MGKNQVQKRATINDVAKAASVGKVTVSYVMNGRAKEFGITDETTNRVLKAAKDLDYRPNGVARMLARQRTDIIAVVFQEPNYFSLGSNFLNEVLRGVCTECVDQGLDLLLHTRRSVGWHDEADALSDGRVDGVLILRDQDDDTLLALAQRNFPMVLFFSRSDDPAISYVDCDNVAGGRIAAEHLLGLGHRRLGLVVGRQGSVDSMDRQKGFQSVVAKHADAEVVGSVELQGPTASPEELIALLTSEHRPTALFVWSDDVAFKCMKVAQDLNLRVPEDLSIVGFDSTPACEMSHPPLTSVGQPVEEMARTATKFLAHLVSKKGSGARQHVFAPRLDVRSSTARYQP